MGTIPVLNPRWEGVIDEIFSLDKQWCLVTFLENKRKQSKTKQNKQNKKPEKGYFSLSIPEKFRGVGWWWE